jgi:hypothetical protein
VSLRCLGARSALTALAAAPWWPPHPPTSPAAEPVPTCILRSCTHTALTPGTRSAQVMGDASPEADKLMRSQGVRALPSFHFWKNSNKLDSISGAREPGRGRGAKVGEGPGRAPGPEGAESRGARPEGTGHCKARGTERRGAHGRLLCGVMLKRV